MIDKYKPLIVLVFWWAMIGIQAGWPHASWEPEAATAITAVLAALHFTAPSSGTPAEPTDKPA